MIFTVSEFVSCEKVTFPRMPPESMGAYSWKQAINSATIKGLKMGCLSPRPSGTRTCTCGQEQTRHKHGTDHGWTWAVLLRQLKHRIGRHVGVQLENPKQPNKVHENSYQKADAR